MKREIKNIFLFAAGWRCKKFSPGRFAGNKAIFFFGLTSIVRIDSLSGVILFKLKQMGRNAITHPYCGMVNPGLYRNKNCYYYGQLPTLCLLFLFSLFLFYYHSQYSLTVYSNKIVYKWFYVCKQIIVMSLMRKSILFLSLFQLGGGG